MLVERTKHNCRYFSSIINFLSTSLATETNQLSYYPNNDTSELYLSMQTMALLRSWQMTVMPGGFSDGILGLLIMFSPFCSQSGVGVCSSISIFESRANFVKHWQWQKVLFFVLWFFYFLIFPLKGSKHILICVPLLFKSMELLSGLGKALIKK